MGLTGEAKKKYQREYMKRKRSNIGSNTRSNILEGSNMEGLTSDTTKDIEGFLKAEGVTEGVTLTEGVTYPDILDKLTDPRWRENLEKVCAAFERSNNPSYSKDVWLGNTNLSIACDWLKCTS